jgi:GT2 family glycosyltransferase
VTPHLAVLLTCHNRRDQTLACLRSIDADLGGRVSFEVFLTDDGSTDGTAAAVAREFPRVHIVPADGTLFWCRGMERAWRAALDAGASDWFLWVNDDVEFFPSALATYLERSFQLEGEPGIIVGSVRDPESGELTYGGQLRTSSWHPGRMVKVMPDDEEHLPIDTFNGNVVLIAQRVVDEIGLIDPTFSHATGDVDYGLRATAAGVPVLLAPGTVGTCRRNPAAAPSLRNTLSRRGLPPRDWYVYTRRHGGRLRWPVAFASPYLRLLAAGFLAKLRRNDA